MPSSPPLGGLSSTVEDPADTDGANDTLDVPLPSIGGVEMVGLRSDAAPTAGDEIMPGVVEDAGVDTAAGAEKEVEMDRMAETDALRAGDGGMVLSPTEDTLVQMETSVVVEEPKTDGMDLVMEDADVNGETNAAIMDRESEIIVDGMVSGI